MKKYFLLVLFLALSMTFYAKPTIHFVSESIVRVQWSPSKTVSNNATGMCIYKPQQVKVEVKRKGDKTSYLSSQLIVEVNEGTTEVRFIDRKSKKVLLHELLCECDTVVNERVIYDDASTHIEETANGKVTVKNEIGRDIIGSHTSFKVHFDFMDAQAIYGLGSHMEDYMNLFGKTLYLTQHNLKAFIPMLNSPNGYGLLFDAGCAMKFSSKLNEKGKGYKGSMYLAAAKEVDFYFIKGKKMNDVVAGYRYLTGEVSLMPRYVFGYTQSKERYVSSDDIIGTLREYRRRHVPIDMIVQDWNYWPQGWGYMKMDSKYYPDPKALADSVHAMNAKLMISIWPNPQYCPEEEDFKQRGFMLEHSVYDAFNPQARAHYWKYANDEFFSRGFDAWWCDSSEPLDGDWNKLPEPQNGKPYSWDDQARRWELNNAILSETLGAERSCLYSLYHSMGIYQNQRKTTLQKRVVNLTRSTYAGQQRYGTIVWNGDTHASWKSFRQQIPAGLNYVATGSPYWTVDVGSFFTRTDPRWFYKGEFPEGVKEDAYKEYYVRMFQWATFLPVLRSHGSDTPREIWRFGEPGTLYYDAILKMINLRYAMVPYVYSMAACQWRNNYSMARPLAFDFPTDTTVFDLKDQYMFGDFLVCPVTHSVSETTIRRVYLPKGTDWYDYWTGKVYAGGEWMNIKTEINSLPLFVKCGSIVPTTEVAEYTGAQVGKPITLRIYPGADATFELYDDEGDNYNYQQNKYSIVKLLWNNHSRTLTIDDRKGSFAHMNPCTSFVIDTPYGSKEIAYKGNKVSVKF